MHKNYVVIDIETSGVFPGDDRIIWISALKVVEHNIVGQFFSYMRTGVQLSPEVLQILTNVKQDLIETAPYPIGVLKDLIVFVDSLPVICHNASFVKGFLEDELRQYSLDGFLNYTCTLEIARQKFPGMRVDAEALLELLSLNSYVDHNYPVDTYEVYQIYEEFKKRHYV
jgi:DNA polymerase III alpha subunit (gram-positive type)